MFASLCETILTNQLRGKHSNPFTQNYRKWVKIPKIHISFKKKKEKKRTQDKLLDVLYRYVKVPHMIL